MGKRDKWLAMAIAVFLCAALCGTAMAGGPLPEGTGSITFNMKDSDSGAVVPGGSLMIRAVAEPVFHDGDAVWEYNEAFAGCGLSLEKLSSADLAKGLADYAAANKIPGRTVSIGTDGRAVVQDVPVGLYLVTQVKSARGYSAFRPFLITVPETVDGNYNYHVNASPKLELHKTPAPPPPSPPSRLPQTGQLWWPVPVLAGLGLLFLVLGIRKRADRS